MSEQLDQQVASVMDKKTSSGKSGKPVGIFLFGVILVCALVFFGGGYVFAKRQAKQGSQHPFVLTVSRMMSFPAARINGHAILYHEYMTDLRTLRFFYENAKDLFPVTPTSEQISNQVLGRLFINNILLSLSKTYNVEVTDEEVAKTKEELLKPFPDIAAAEADIKKRYNWDMDTYVERIVRPLLLQQKVQEAFVASDSEEAKKYESGEEVHARHILFQFPEVAEKDAAAANKALREKAQGVLERVKAGEDFSALAAEFGSDATQFRGGDLGWFGKGIMVEAFDTAVWALEPGQVSPELVETPYGYHIIRVEGKRIGKDFAAFMSDKIEEADIEMVIAAPNPFAGGGYLAPEEAQGVRL